MCHIVYISYCNPFLSLVPVLFLFESLNSIFLLLFFYIYALQIYNCTWIEIAPWAVVNLAWLREFPLLVIVCPLFFVFELGVCYDCVTLHLRTSSCKISRDQH